MTKLCYNQAHNKHRVRSECFDIFRKQSNISSTNRIVGLGGPNIDRYVGELESKGFNNITIYENNKRILLTQLGLISSLNINYIFGDITYASLDNKVLYDLDYCCTIKYLDINRLHMIENHIITLSLRGVSSKKTLDRYFENAVDDGNYIYKVYNYKDTSCMLTIAKIKKDKSIN